MLTNKYYIQDQHGPHKFFELDDFQFESGEILTHANLAYTVHVTRLVKKMLPKSKLTVW